MQVSKLVFAISFLFLGCTDNRPLPEIAAPDHPEAWAAAMNETPGLTNFYKVSDDLYRGAQPDTQGFDELRKLGIQSVVNLRTLHSDKENCASAGLKYFHISVQAWSGEDKEVVEFLRVVTDPDNLPVFVHCEYGADRTGVMSAVYRIVIQGWSKEEAIREMTDGGFGFHPVWQNLITYVEELDIDLVKARVGMADVPR